MSKQDQSGNTSGIDPELNEFFVKAKQEWIAVAAHQLSTTTSVEKGDYSTYPWKQFLHLPPNMYTLDGYEGLYIFELKIYDDVRIFLERLPLHNRVPQTASSKLYEFPSLEKTNRKKDEEIMKRILRTLDLDLKRTWENLNTCKTPSTTDSSVEDLEDDSETSS